MTDADRDIVLAGMTAFSNRDDRRAAFAALERLVAERGAALKVADESRALIRRWANSYGEIDGDTFAQDLADALAALDAVTGGHH